MQPRLRFFHTGDQHVAAFDALLDEMAPDVPRDHTVRADLLAEAQAQGHLTDEIAQATADALKAVAGEGTLTLCTCSTIGPAVDAALAGAASPILRVDRPMAERAVDAASTITIAACVPTTIGPTRDLVLQVARDKGKQVEIEELQIFHAWPHFLANDRKAYVDEIERSLRDLAATTEVVLLAQASMAGAAERCADLPFAVLSSPRLGVEAALAAYRKLA